MSTPLLKFPSSTELSLYLLKEELKMNRFFTDLHALGIENHSPFQLELAPAVFACMGLVGTDEAFERYATLLAKHSKDMGSDNESMVKATLAFYADLPPSTAHTENQG